MQDARIRLAIAIFGLMILGGCGAMLYAAHRTSPPAVIITPPPNATQASTPPPPPKRPKAHLSRAKPVPAGRIVVHVAGAVRKPWLYSVPAGSRVLEAVLAAGGPTPDADINDINLAEKLHDGEKVFVPAKQPSPPVTSSPAPSTPAGNALGQQPVASSLPTVIETGSFGAAKITKLAKSGKSDKITSAADGQIDISTATAAQLERLPDVGPAMAARIIAYRTQAHGFQSVAELQQVGGIGPKKFAKIEPLVTLGPN